MDVTNDVVFAYLSIMFWFWSGVSAIINVEINTELSKNRIIDKPSLKGFGVSMIIASVAFSFILICLGLSNEIKKGKALIMIDDLRENTNLTEKEIFEKVGNYYFSCPSSSDNEKEKN